MGDRPIVTRTHPDVPRGTSYLAGPQHRDWLPELGITDVPDGTDVLLMHPADLAAAARER